MGPGTSSLRRQSVWWLATILACVSVAIVVFGLLGVDTNGPEDLTYVAIAFLMAPAVGLAYLPLAFSGETGFRISTALVGVCLMIAGLPLGIIYIGLLMIPIGLGYMVIAAIPPRADQPR